MQLGAKRVSSRNRKIIGFSNTTNSLPFGKPLPVLAQQKDPTTSKDCVRPHFTHGFKEFKMASSVGR
jgi:hypothetical protein